MDVKFGLRKTKMLVKIKEALLTAGLLVSLYFDPEAGSNICLRTTLRYNPEDRDLQDK
jgi:hypothetical protein